MKPVTVFDRICHLAGAGRRLAVLAVVAVFAAGLAVVSPAQPAAAQDPGLTWYLEDVIFNTGATASGSFRYNSATNTYSDINIVVRNSPGNGASNTYTMVNPSLGSNGFLARFVTEVRPDMTGVKNLQLDFRPELKNSGGTSPITPGVISFQGNCDNTCVTSVAPYDDIVSGSVTTESREWHLRQVAFHTGATASGSFRYNSATNTYSDINIVVRNSPGNGASNTYTMVNPSLGSNGFLARFVTEVRPDMTGVKNLQLDFRPELKNSGGTSPITPGVISFQGNCDNTCVTSVAPYDDIVSGSATTEQAPPTITSGGTASAPENQTSAIDVQATDANDAENAGLTFAKSGGADQALFSIDANTGVLTFVNAPDFEAPGDNGTNNVYEVGITVTDSGGLTATQNIAITVTDVAENTAPTVATIADQTVDEGASVSIPVSSTDADGDSLVLSTDGLPSFCSLTDAGDGTGTIGCNPGFDDAGTSSITVLATDGGSPPLVGSASFSFTVTNANRGPVVTPIDAQSVDEGQNIGVPISATDPDGDNVSLGTANVPSFCLVGTGLDGTGTISCTPGFDDAGTYQIEVNAQDDGTPGLGSAIVFQLTVNNVNRAPDVANIATQSVDEGQTISIPVSSTDPDGNALALSSPELVGFCSLTDNGDGTGSIDCAPGFLDSGTYPVSVTGTDDGTPNLTDTESFLLNVVEINNPPTVDAGADAEVTVPNAVQLTGSATDDGNPTPPGTLTYAWTVVSGAGTVIFVDASSPTTSAVFEGGGDFVLRLTASDGRLTGSDEVTVTVNNPLGCTIFGTNGPDDLNGTNGPDVICGFAGNDDINGFGGDDTIFGGTGNDKMIGGGGNDTMSSPSGVNTFKGQGGNDIITGGGGVDTVDGGGGSDTIHGRAGDDKLTGGTGGDTITGGAGNDELRGGAGNDKLRDAAGDDMLFGQADNDFLRDLVGTNFFNGGSGTDRCIDTTGNSAC